MKKRSPPASVLSAIAAKRPSIPEDKLEALRTMIMEKLDLERELESVEEKKTSIERQINDLILVKLPDLMDEIGVPSITIAAKGNLPEVTAKLSPFYKANIEASWEEARRRAAFDWLDKNGHGDLIKTEVAVAFSREKRKNALAFADEARKKGEAPIVKEAVPWSTLTAWLREQVEEENHLPPLDIIGGYVGRVVKIKE